MEIPVYGNSGLSMEIPVYGNSGLSMEIPVGYNVSSKVYQNDQVGQVWKNIIV